MNDEQTSPTSGLRPEYRNYDKQRCFVGHSVDAPWRDDLVITCNEVLPDFGLEPWYAADHFTTKSLREKVVALIANTRYGIYDLSYWRKDDKSEWQMPRNVFIELGIAIALNRPMLLLRHKSNPVACLPLPQCLESISTHILKFSGAKTLRDVLKKQLAEWANTPPDQDWWNRYCTFGSRICEYREAHPHVRQWGEETVRCHISDGQDTDRPDFREVVEEVLGRFNDVSFDYLDALSPCKGYDFLLCTHCQTVRSTPFAIYRITEHTPAETFIVIGISLALETQFTHTIPKILLTSHITHIPSLLTGYEVVVAQNDYERKTSLRKFMPQVIKLARKTTWKPRPLPFIEIFPQPVERPSDENEQESEQESEVYIDTIGEYGLIRKMGLGAVSTIYLVCDTKSKQNYVMKIQNLELGSNDNFFALFQREAQILSLLSDPHIVEFVDYGNENNKHYIVQEYIEGQNLESYMIDNGPMELSQALNYIRQVAEGLDTAYKQGIVHRNIRPQSILIDNKDEVKICGFSLARFANAISLTAEPVFTGTAYYISPEQAQNGHSADTRSDLYSMAVILFEMLTGKLLYDGETYVDIATKHRENKIPSVRQQNPNLPREIDLFMQKALAKSPADRYQTPHEFIAALNELSEKIKAPPEQATRNDYPDNLIGKRIGQFRIVERIGEGGLTVVFKAYQSDLDRYAAIKVLQTHLACDPASVERFTQEARLMAKLNHPNIVRFYEFGRGDTDPYIAMEYVNGGTLRDLLKNSLPMDDAINFIVQAAEGLDHIHQNSIIHRNVKPHNMLLTNTKKLLLSGSDLIKPLEGGTASAERIMGTPFYMAPEQIVGWPLDQRTDIYLLGIVLFECLTGHRPFTGSEPSILVMKHINDPLPVDDLRRSQVPEWLEEVVLKMTAKRPEDRYQSMREVIDALHTLLFCPICGAEVRNGDAYCLNCGQRIISGISEVSQPPQWIDPSTPTLFPYEDVLTTIVVERSPFQDLLALTPNGDAVEDPEAPSQYLLENTNYIGQTISTYRIESEIGRGGLARVYLAQHVNNNSLVAIKIFYAHLSEKQKRNLSLQETLLRNSLNHPYILPVFEVSLQKQPQYVICENVTGGTLHDRILLQQPQPLPLQEAVAILSQVGEALAFIHQQGIVHRDLKPANILFNESGEVRLADFDLAVTLGKSHDTKKVDTAGSPPYMAPEQFEGMVSRYSDQYALGCIAYELCTGTRPFNADNFTALHFKHVSEQVLAPRLLNPDLPVHIERAILRALAKRPDERFSDVMAFVEELRGS